MEDSKQKIVETDDPQVPGEASDVENAQMEASRSEAAESPKRKKRFAVGVAAALAVALVGGGIAYAVSRSPQPEEPAQTPAKAQTQQVSKKSQEERQSEIVVTVMADAEGATLTKVKVAALGTDGEEAVAETAVAANEAVSLGKLDKGDYELCVTAAPVADDGSTFKLPDEPVRFTVDGSGDAASVEVALVRLPKEEMSKEQLEAASFALEAAGKADAAQTVKAAAQEAPSVPGSAESVQRPATPSGGGSGDASKPSGSEGGSGGAGGTETPSTPSKPEPVPPSNPTVPEPEPEVPSTPSHTCSFDPITEERWVVTGQGPDYDHPSYVYYCSDCGCDLASAEEIYNEIHLHHHTGSRAEYPTIDYGVWEFVTVGWHPCPVCGATK